MRYKFYLLFFVVFSLSVGSVHAQIITTIAGGHTGSLGDGGPATDAALSHPISVAFDYIGNYYITDRDDNRIRKVATDGIITTIAGMSGFGFNGDNIAATAALLNVPYGIAVDKTGNIYFSDNGNDRIRKVNASGIITTIAGTGIGGYNGDNIPATAAEFLGLGAIAFDSSGNLFLIDENRVRKIDPVGIITTVTGTGTAGYNGDEIPATDAQVSRPNYVATDKAGNLYIADYGNNRIRKIDATGTIHTIAGSGTQGYTGDNGAATLAKLYKPLGVNVDDFGNVYISDSYNNVIRKVNSAGVITTIAGKGTAGFSGDGGSAVLSELFSPVGITTNTVGDIYIADAGNSRIRKIQSTVSINHIKGIEHKISVFPNPCNGNFTIHIDLTTTQELKIIIADMLGRSVKEITAYGAYPVDVDISELPAGVYIVKVSSDGWQVVSKVIRE
jgi:trimeric autotransporter adhesin